ncbi:MAG TPA: SRPBCC domain-containing protein [Pseudonocardiaceae bacterium]
MSESMRVAPDGRGVLRLERRLAHPVRMVWAAVTEPGQLRHWFPCAVRWEPVVGSPIAFDFGGGPEVDGEVVAWEEPRLVAFTWGTDELRVELTPDGEAATLLVFEHVFADRAGGASFAAGWTACLRGLALLLAGEQIPPAGRMVAEHERFVRLFGLDEGTADGRAVRFERQLTVPAAEAWAALPRTGPVTRQHEPVLLECGPVRYELGPGTGHGARLTVTVEDVADLAAALAEWRDRLNDLGATLAAREPAPAG